MGHLHWICLYFDIGDSMVVWGVCLPWVDVHSLFLHRMLGMSTFLHMLYCNLFGVVVLHRSVVDERCWWGQSAMGICAFSYI